MANTLQEAKIRNRCALAFLIPNAARLGVKIEAERDDYGLGYRLVDAKTSARQIADDGTVIGYL